MVDSLVLGARCSICMLCIAWWFGKCRPLRALCNIYSRKRNFWLNNRFFSSLSYIIRWITCFPLWKIFSFYPKDCIFRSGQCMPQTQRIQAQISKWLIVWKKWKRVKTTIFVYILFFLVVSFSFCARLFWSCYIVRLFTRFGSLLLSSFSFIYLFVRLFVCLFPARFP